MLTAGLVLRLPVASLVAAVACSPSTAGSTTPPPASAVSAPSAAGGEPTGLPLPSLPAGVTIVRTATAELRLGSPARGSLAVIIEARSTSAGTTVTAQYQRSVRCRFEPSSLAVCDTLYDVRRTLPVSAFTYDETLDRSSLLTKVEGRRLAIEWVGFGDTRRSVNDAGALVIDMRDAAARSQWGSFTQQDPKTPDTPAMLGRRVYGP